MKLARIQGYVTATLKHRSLEGWRLLIAQPVTPQGQIDGPPQVVLDHLGATTGQEVIITSDGANARALVGDEFSPARWHTIGIVDPRGSVAL